MCVAAGLCLALSGCGKKAPLRLPDSRKAERAPALAARVREGQVILDFRVPRHRLFPEREEPWVLARILRQSGAVSEAVEAGVILEAGGFPFDAPLTWTDRGHAPGSSFSYRVEFRDAARRRRAASDPVAVSWSRVPEAPSDLTAVGGVGAVSLTWTAPTGDLAGVGYRVYRRDATLQTAAAVSPGPVTECRFVDVRIDSGRTYCYTVTALLSAEGLEVEGPAGAEVCAGTTALAPPPSPQPPGSAP